MWEAASRFVRKKRRKKKRGGGGGRLHVAHPVG